MMRSGRRVVALVALALVSSTAASAAVAPRAPSLVAYSSKVARARVEEAARRGVDFRRRDRQLFELGGITRPWAVVVDAGAGDWILVGEKDPKAARLTLDDWVVALRARFLHADTDPGVTIERRPSDACLRAGLPTGCPDATEQDVRFFGGIADTRFGQVCLQADLLMKHIGLGVDRVPVVGLRTYYDLAAEELRRRGGPRRQVASRFWFYPSVNHVSVVDDVVALDRFQMRVFTEVLYVEVDGKRAPDAERLADAPSEAFSRSLDERYDAVAAARPVLETLRGLTRLAALTKGLTLVDPPGPAEYYLERYPLERVATPREEAVQSAKGGKTGVRLSGGVTIAALATRVQGGDASALRSAVLGARPSGAALTWTVPGGASGGPLAGVRLPPSAARDAEVASALSRAVFLHQTKRYDDAIDAYGRALALAPDLVPAYVSRGQAQLRSGRPDLAIADYDRAMHLDPRAAAAYNGRGLAYQGKGDAARAMADYDRALALDRRLASAYNNRGLAHSFAGESDRAIADFDRALALDSGLAEAYLNRGVARVAANAESAGAWQRALADFDQSLALDRTNAQAYYWRALARFDDYQRATADLDTAIALDPGLAQAGYYAKAEIADQAGRSAEAEQAYRRFLEVAPPDGAGVDKARDRLRRPEGQR